MDSLVKELDQETLLAQFAAGGDASKFCGQWLSVEANDEDTLTKEGVVSLASVLDGATVQPN